MLRDLLVCLVKKYRADEPKGGPSAKNRIWADLSREYHRLSGGLLNANQKQLLTKWNNLKFHARQRGKPNPGNILYTLDEKSQNLNDFIRYARLLCQTMTFNL